MPRPKSKDPLEKIVSLKVSSGQLKKIAKIRRRFEREEKCRLSQSEVLRRLIEAAA